MIEGKEGVEKMIENEYRHNEEFRRYVDKYCSAHGISVEEALRHAIVIEKFHHLRDV